MKKRRKNKKQENNTIMLALISVFVILFLILVTVMITTQDEVYQELEQDGYYTETEDAFYKKVLTNNTLNEFYNDMNSGRDANYYEAYVSKESYDYIELKMIHKGEMTTTLTISSNLKSNEVYFNYEYSKGKAYLLLEGTEANNYACEVTTIKNLKQSAEDDYCTLVKDDINTFLTNKQTLLNNQNLIDKIFNN